MAYLEIRISAAGGSKEAITNRLFEMGSLGFQEEADDIVAYFGSERSAAELCGEMDRFRTLLASSGLEHNFSLACNTLPERDWNEDWKKSFAPIDAGEDLTIIPSWLKHETTRTPVIIDPGMVFGTGHHETTRTCLGLIEKAAKTGLRGTLLDIGTGTGILAIGAARLGFKKVVAVDIDPLAIDAAARNASANNLNNIEVKEGDITSASGTFDVIVANLLSEILLAIAIELSSRLNAGGTAILSGLLSGQEDSVIEAMTAAGLHLHDKIIDGKWVSLVMGK